MNENKINICLLDFDDLTVDLLKHEHYNVYNGSLGTKVNFKYNAYRHNVYCKSNVNIPSNFHEFNIIAVDLNDNMIVPFNPIDHVSESIAKKSDSLFKLSYPTNVFNPTPIGSYILNKVILESEKTTKVVIVFAGKEFSTDFSPVEVIDGGYNDLREISLNNYCFINSEFLSDQKHGKIHSTNIIKEGALGDLLNKYNDLEYHQLFQKPYFIDDKTSHFTPLMFNNTSEIISFVFKKENFTLFVFPDIKDKTGFLKEFLTNICPEYLPDLFIDDLAWLKRKEYWLPTHETILNKKDNLIEEYNHKLSQIDKEIGLNYEKYSFLHDLITETGDKLVDAVIKIMNYIGFDSVAKIDDKISNGVFEEDIQIIHNGKLLVIEVKGIFGTSKDSECSQISKIRLRRMKEKDTTNVYALYIVNNERNKPLSHRTNPPFNKIQIDDALNDDRGLLTSTALFNLYYNIESGILEKDEVKEAFFDYGLVNFIKNFTTIGRVEKTYSQDTVASINLENAKIKIGDKLYSEINGKLLCHIVKSIQQNRIELNEVDNGITGICLDSKIKPKAILYKKD